MKSHQLLKSLGEQRRKLGLFDKKLQPIRVGFCGSPGAGKSSLIEKLGVYICNLGVKLAVLVLIRPMYKSIGNRPVV